jgi:hypothetical protein
MDDGPLEEISGLWRHQVKSHTLGSGPLAHQGDVVGVTPEGANVGFDPLQCQGLYQIYMGVIALSE